MLDKIRLMRPAPPALVLFGCNTYAELFGTEELRSQDVVGDHPVRSVLYQQ